MSPGSPEIAIALAMTLSIAVSPARVGMTAGTAPGRPITGGAIGSRGSEGPQGDEARMLALVNGERERRGLAPLSWSGNLAGLALRHALDMRKAGRASHLSRDGTTFEQRLVRADMKLQAAAENVGYARDVARAHEGLMESPGHRANILDSRMRHIGIGLARDRRGVYVVQDFALFGPDLSESGASGRVRAAVKALAESLEEDPALSRRMTAEAKRLAESDSIDVKGLGLEDDGWIVAWTTADPGEIHESARQKLAGYARYGVGLAFRRTPSYPFGTWWVVLAIEGRAR